MKTVLSLILLAVLLLAPLSGANAAHYPSSSMADIDFNQLDRYIQAQMDKHALPGVSLAVIQGDKTVYAKGYGTASGTAMTPQTPMFIGSLSKSFTALTIAQLADAGKIDLNAPVQKYIPWFKVADEEASAKITVSHLLHHTSGLSEAGFSVVLPDDATSEEAVRALAKAELSAPVGSKFQYFNLGYATLSYLVEIISGESYPGYLQAHIFEPLGMTSTTADPSLTGGLARGYTRLFGFPVRARQPVRVHSLGAGYIVSTAEDLARYAAAMKNGGELGSVRLVSPEMARTMFTAGQGDYGMGWFVEQNGLKISHGGANETFGTDLNMYPSRALAFVLLVNEGHLLDHSISAEQLLAGVEGIILGRSVPPVSQGVSVKFIGWGIGIFVILILILNVRNFYALFTTWSEHYSRLSQTRRILDVAISFIIPTIILLVVFSQLQAYFGYRFNLLTTVAQFRHSMPDVFILMIVGALLDYVQGIIKVVFILAGKTKTHAQTAPAYSY